MATRGTQMIERTEEGGIGGFDEVVDIGRGSYEQTVLSKGTQ